MKTCHAVIILIVFLLSTGLAGQSSWAGTWTPETVKAGIGIYSIPSSGTLQVSVPPTWKSRYAKGKDANSDTITLEPVSGNSFVMLIDVFTKPNGSAFAPEDLAVIKKDVEDQKNNMLPQAKETQIDIKEAKSTDVTGYYFTIEDKSPDPGKWAFLTEGEMVNGKYCLRFSIFTRSADSTEKTDGLTLLTTCKFNGLTSTKK
jgi:hypothetical protein